ncbi:hypothetical protein [Paenibacillus ferrarius]|uniref:hypothetical protein n=1 Tax=Paenibacillus ferrarius TaxID=1469647 RepID=UPI003D2B146A
MVFVQSQLVMLQALSYATLFVFAGLAFYHALQTVPSRPKRWRPRHGTAAQTSMELPGWCLALLVMKPKKLEHKRQLLQGCGMALHAQLYEVIRKALLGLCVAGFVLGYEALKYPGLTLHVQPVYVMAGAATGFIFGFWDEKLLAQVKDRRGQRIVRDIYAVSRQLLFYAESRRNVHEKLNLCVLQTTVLRPHLQLLLNEWYQGAEEAIAGFKQRVGTEEAHSFGETLNALRLHDHADYYQLLRQRVQDYKDKIELIRDTKKETVSYVLFVLAGLPILNTFRVFMYPWIAEGQRLFHSIN